MGLYTQFPNFATQTSQIEFETEEMENNLSADDVITTATRNFPETCEIHFYLLRQYLTENQLFYYNPLGLGPIFALGLVGNILIILGLHKHKHKTTAFFLCQVLAIADISLLLSFINYGVINTFSYLQYTGVSSFYEYQLSAYLFKFGDFWTGISVLGNIWTTVLIGINRYIAVCYPLRATRLCARAIFRRAALVILLFVSAYSAVLLGRRTIVQKQINGTLCNTVAATNFAYSKFSRIYVGLTSPFVYYIIPLGSLIFMTLKIIVEMRRASKRRAKMSSTEIQDNKVTRALLVVLVMFTLCQLPTIVIMILYAAIPDLHISRAITHILSHTLLVLNSSVNYVIYITFSKSFRDIMWRPLCGKTPNKYIKPEQPTHHVNKQPAPKQSTESAKQDAAVVDSF